MNATKNAKKYSVEINFTETYRRFQNEHSAIREANCLKAQFPDILTEILDVDLIAGRIRYGMAGFSPQFGGFGYFCNEQMILDAIEGGTLGPDLSDRLMDVMLFWRKETTTRKIEARFTEEMAAALCREKIAEFPFRYEPEAATPLYRMAGIYVDYDKLLKLGISGMKKEVEERRQKAAGDGGDDKLFEGMLIALDLLRDVCLFYHKQATDLAEDADATRKKQLLKMAEVLENIAFNRPESFYEALQLAWIYSIVCGSMEYGRMDSYLGDFYAHDIDNGIITEKEALSLLQSVWRMINDLITEVDGRVIIGGKGRPNEKNADRLALLILETTRTVRDILPQLTLRFYEGMDPALMEKSIDIIGEGTTYPLLYNDDVNIEAVRNAQQVSKEEAEQYVPLGCGEIVINHSSYGTPSGSINLLKTLEITLHNGVDPITNQQAGPKTGKFEDFKTFDDLFDAFSKQVTYFVEILADHEELEYKVAGESAPFLFISMLYDDCIARGKGAFAGGIRYLGGTLESYGNVNTADSLTAIKELVYDKKLFTNDRMLKILDGNFNGYENERKMMAACPKYGNDDDIPDEMLQKVHSFVCNTIRDQRNRTKLHSYLAVIINNSMNTTLGRWVGASADGRKAGGAMANANTPAGGNDKKGITALINSIVKPSPAIHAGSVQNFRFGRDIFLNDRAKLELIMKTYFKKGGNQAMLTVINRGDLEKAMQEPEKYRNIFVRVGGFSARFVDLPKDVQRELLSRNTY